jgi:uncharacterized protein with von Willebrand factor type A (vWA) domain
MSGASLVLHLALFGRALRQRGVRISLSDEADGLAALSLVDVGDRDEVRRALRTALKVGPRDVAVFEELFARLWRGQAQPGDGEAPEQPRFVDPTKPPAAQPRPARVRPLAGAPPPAAAGADSECEVPEGEEPGFSPEARLRRKSFEDCSPADWREMERLMARLALRLATRRSRRRVPAPCRGEPDLRRSFRRAVARGGEFSSLARRARPIEEPRLVVLCDTSGSMDPYTRFLLGFVMALRRVTRGSEIFAFNTRLVRLTPWLRALRSAQPERIDLTLARIAAGVPDWSGGTRIGECLAEFATRHLGELVSSQTVVIILSDGLDRGDVQPLQGAMHAIHAKAKRILWLNPLAGDRRYEPTARAMAAALPYIDRLLPAHNLESLERLLPLLAA